MSSSYPFNAFKTAAQFTSINPVVPVNLFYMESDTGKVKRGTGAVWTSTAYWNPAGSDDVTYDDLTVVDDADIGGDVIIGAALDHNGTTVGFYGVTPVTQPTAITQTFATADATHAARTGVALTDSAAGTPSTTLAALPNPTDTPATADALRDDLVAVHWPILRNAISSLAVEHNKVIVDLADTAQLLNSVVDKLQALGLIA